MAEKKQEVHEEHKDNTGMIIAVVVIFIFLIGLLAYLMMNGKDDVREAIDKTEDTIESVTDNTKKTAADVAGFYQAKYKLNTDELDTTEDSDEYIELLLNDDNTATIVMTSNSDEAVDGTFTINQKKLILIVNENTGITSNDITGSNSNNSQRYEFTINDDNTLIYHDNDNEITLAKVNNDALKYLK